jgi:1,4-dihydroxy-2-naphthoate octaprenyltransferase
MSNATTTPTVLQSWLGAFRLRTLPLAAASILLGGFLAFGAGSGSWSILLLCLLTALLLQILSNLANDYGDFVSGIDAERQGPTRYVQAGLITQKQMLRAIVICALLAAVVGLVLVIYAVGIGRLPWVLLFVGLGGASVYAAITYTAGNNPYGYVGLGDVAVLVFFGWVGTLGTYFLQTLTLNWLLLLPATAVGLFAVGVLNINNIRDLESDRKAGKRSIPVRLGARGARIYHWLLLGSGVLCATLYVLLTAPTAWHFLFVLALPLLLRNGLTVWRATTPAEVAPMLKQMSLSTLVFVLTFGVGHLL